MAAHRVLEAMADVLPDVVTPLLAIDLDAVAHNIAAMTRFSGPGRWRPHIKTVKQRRVIEMLLDADVTSLKCATLDELALILRVAVSRDVEVDVLLAYPPLGPAMDGVIEMATQVPGSAVRVLADHPAHLEELARRSMGAPDNVTVMLDVDVGMARTGSVAEGWRDAGPQIAAAGSRICGVHGYEGHLRWDQRDEADQCYAALLALMATLSPEQTRLMVTSGTHSFHHALANANVAAGSWRHQVSPGTLILSDLRSADAAELLDLKQAAFVLSRVMSKSQPHRLTLDAGSKALNPDCPAPGCALLGYPDWVGQTASEEHRPFSFEPGPAGARGPGPDQGPRFGEVLALVPEHVCTTVNMFREVFHVRAGEPTQRHAIEAASRTHDALGRLPKPR